ncbi:MAG: hypothetical protein JW932_05360 [Deltaproteobacteria bacterium]|nr:hypothetical protein [Deltaproteobacteria bacterium]
MGVAKDTATDIIVFRYVFTFNDGPEKEYIIKLDKQTLCLIQTGDRPPSPWAALKHFKCPNCPLDGLQYEFCPTATNLIQLIDDFKDRESIEEVEVLIETPERRYIKQVPLQTGLSSLLGIYMVTTGCPILEKLKPMVRYHLPFPSMEETTYRSVTMYLLAQFFFQRKGHKPDWNLNNLAAVYNDIQVVNKNIRDKLLEIANKDATANALVKLDYSALYISLRLNRNILDEIESYFNAYFV